MLLPLGLALAAMALAAAVAGWTSASGAAVILIMLPTVALMGATTAVLQSGVFALAGLCPPIYVQVCLKALEKPLSTRTSSSSARACLRGSCCHFRSGLTAQHLHKPSR